MTDHGLSLQWQYQQTAYNTQQQADYTDRKNIVVCNQHYEQPSTYISIGTDHSLSIIAMSATNR